MNTFEEHNYARHKKQVELTWRVELSTVESQQQCPQLTTSNFTIKNFDYFFLNLAAKIPFHYFDISNEFCKRKQ